MRGRRPKPPALRVLQGSRGRKAKRTGGQPKPRIEPLEPPFFITGDALAEWNRREPELRRLGILTSVDFAVFVGYCRTYGRVCEAERALKETGMTLTSPSGIERTHPVARERSEAMRDLVKFAAELGITPSSRGRVTPVDVGGGEVNPFSLINGGQKDPDDGVG